MAPTRRSHSTRCARAKLGSAVAPASSRRATCSFWTRSVVRMNSTRRPFEAPFKKTSCLCEGPHTGAADNMPTTLPNILEGRRSTRRASSFIVTGIDAIAQLRPVVDFDIRRARERRARDHSDGSVGHVLTRLSARHLLKARNGRASVQASNHLWRQISFVRPSNDLPSFGVHPADRRRPSLAAVVKAPFVSPGRAQPIKRR
jgi:hypothetical protein